jgi:threonine aldolase
MKRMNLMRSFASDNNSGIHPDILAAIKDANKGLCIAYGDDPYTERAMRKCKEHFGDEIDVYFVLTGTGANVLGTRAALESFEAVICSDISHLNLDECAAPENFSGCKLLLIQTKNGKFSPDDVRPLLSLRGDEHHVQPKVISITQTTELGTVYTREEVRLLADFAHAHELILHMDGARLSNAAASLNLTLKEITTDAGVDILSFGGTKNGMMIGEAVIFFNRNITRNFMFIRKQGMQLFSKMRFISAQFEAFLSDDLWLRNARHANRMARLLASELKKIHGCTITQNVEANGVFASLPNSAIDEIRSKYFFYVIYEEKSIIRLMTSFNTQEEEIHDFIRVVKEVIES